MFIYLIVVDSLESIDQDYVMVSGPKTDLSSSARALRSTHSSFKAGSPPVDSLRTNPTPSDPVPIIGGATVRVGNNESLESRMSAPGTSQGSMDAADTSEQPPTDFVTRIKSLQRCALAITELVNDKVTCWIFLGRVYLFNLKLVSLIYLWKILCTDFSVGYLLSSIHGIILLLLRL